MSNDLMSIDPDKGGRLIVLSAPAGTGKTTLTNLVCEEFDHVVQSISCTTRAPRPSEQGGIHYHFLTKEQFVEKRERGDFLEWAEVFGDFYGTAQDFLSEQRRRAHVILTIDTQGALQLRNRPDVTLIFLLPPSVEELERRLVLRKTEDIETIQRRLSWAEQEMAMADQYDYTIVNDELQVAYQVLRAIVIAEAHRNSKKQGE